MRWFKNIRARMGSIRPRISLRLSLCLVPICGIGFSWIGHHLREHRAEERYVTQIYALPLAPAKPPSTPVLLPVSGSPNSVWTVNLPTFTLCRDSWSRVTVQYQWHGPAWLEPWFDDSSQTIFHRVSSVEVRGRQVSEALLELRHVKEVILNSCDISQPLLDELNHRKSITSMSGIDCRIDTR